MATVSQFQNAFWAYAPRTLTTGGGTNPTSTKLQQFASAVWANSSRTLTTTTPPEVPGEWGTPTKIVGSPTWQVYSLMVAKPLAPSENRRASVYFSGMAGTNRTLDNTGYPVDFAFIPYSAGQYPDSNTQWHPATVEPDASFNVMLGPKGIALISKTRYRVFVRLRCVGLTNTLFVTDLVTL